MRKISRIKRKEKGQNSIEFAMAVPLMLVVIMGGVQLMMYLAATFTVANAAQYGAEIGRTVQDCSACAAVSSAKSAANSPFLQSSSVAVNSAGGSAGSTLSITVTGQVPLLMPLIGMIPGYESWLTVSETATFRQEGW